MTHSAVVLTLADPEVTAGQRVTVSYTKGPNPIRNAHANGYEAANLDGVAVDNRTSDTRPPRLLAATVQGNVLTLTYDEALDPAHTPPPGIFTVTHHTETATVNDVKAVGRTVVLTLATDVSEYPPGHDPNDPNYPPDESPIVAINYQIPIVADAERRIQDFAGNWAASINLMTVTHGPPPATTPSTPLSPGGGGGGGTGPAEPTEPTDGAPVASAGADVAVDPGERVTLDGSGSSDPDGEALEYAWEQVSGTEVTLSGADAAATASFTAPTEPGSLAFRLTVTDPGGLGASDEVTVTVRDLAPAFG